MCASKIRSNHGPWADALALCLLGSMALPNLACSGSDNANSGLAETGGTLAYGGAANGGQPQSLGGAAPNAGGTPAAGGMPAAGGTPAAGGSDNVTDLAEKGLCQIAMACAQTIVDTPAVPCTVEVKDSAGATVYSDHAAVQIRGRSSSHFPKKNYGLELRTAGDIDNPANLLGMGGEADWILDGAWADRSFMRNRLSFGLFRDIGPERWAPQARYCELTLNGSYAGLYVLVEKIKRDDDRIVLPDDDGTGSTFVVKQDDDGTLKLTIGAGSKWQVVYPSSIVITPTQTQAVQAWLTQLGTALGSNAPVADVLNVLEPAAIVDWILLEEFAKNIDAYNLSLYFVRKAGGLARTVPWDLDLAYGQPTLANSQNDTPQGWVNTRTALISKLSQNPSIRQGLGPRWRELRRGIFSDAAITARLDGYATILNADAIARNFAKWPIESVDFSKYYAPYSFYDVTSYAEEVTHFRTWIQQRLAWLDANIDAYPAK